MKVCIFIISLFVSSTLLGQINFNNPPWQIGCDTIDASQLDMNLCSAQSYKIADSIVSVQYNILLNYLDSLYKVESTNVLPTDTLELDYLKRINKQKLSLMAAQKQFIEYRKNFIDIISNEFYGGSIRPLMVNIYALDVTVNHLKTLTKLIDEIIYAK